MDLKPQPSDRPPGYPWQYRRMVTLRDGRRVFIRPILPSDAPELAEAIKTADADTLRRRFLGGPPSVTPALLAHLTTVDYVQRFALVAIDPITQRGVAIARYEKTGEGLAEIAVVVTPAWRRIGLATVLILYLAKAAVERGIHTFSAFYLAENRPIAALVEDAAGLGRQIIEDGIAEFSLALDNHGPPPAHAEQAGRGQPPTGEARSQPR
jgi:GNAT superfamily N-acetyltransferase